MLPTPLAVLRFMLLCNLATLAIFAGNGLYEMRRGGSRVDQAFKVATAVSLSAVAALVINTLLPQLGSEEMPYSRDMLVWSWAAGIVACVLFRSIHRFTVVRLRRLGVDTRLVIYPGQYHGIKRPSFQRDRLQRHLDWYDRYLRKDDGARP